MFIIANGLFKYMLTRITLSNDTVNDFRSIFLRRCVKIDDCVVNDRELLSKTIDPRIGILIYKYHSVHFPKNMV